MNCISVTGDCINCGETVTSVDGQMPPGHRRGECRGPQLAAATAIDVVRGDTVAIPIADLVAAASEPEPENVFDGIDRSVDDRRLADRRVLTLVEHDPEVPRTTAARDGAAMSAREPTNGADEFPET